MMYEIWGRDVSGRYHFVCRCSTRAEARRVLDKWEKESRKTHRFVRRLDRDTLVTAYSGDDEEVAFVVTEKEGEELAKLRW